MKPKEDTPKQRLLKIEQASDYLNVSKWVIYKMVSNGTIRTVATVGGVKVKGHRFLLEDLNKVRIEKV